jgi:hypothetical protein
MAMENFIKRRPLNPGEFRPNDDGSYSTEMTQTVPFMADYYNIPSLWMTGDGIKEAGSSDEALKWALDHMHQSGERFPKFNSIAEAVASAEARSAGGGVFQGRLTDETARRRALAEIMQGQGNGNPRLGP